MINCDWSRPPWSPRSVHLLSEWGGPDAEVRFLRDFRPGGLQLAELTDTDVACMADLAERYADLRLGGTDASVIAIAERLGIHRIATFDFRSAALHSRSLAPSMSRRSRSCRKPRRLDPADTHVDLGAGSFTGRAGLVHTGQLLADSCGLGADSATSTSR